MSTNIPVREQDAGPERTFLNFLAAGHFMLQRSRKSGQYFYYPRAVTRGTASEDLEWSEVSGLGTVYSTTIVRRKPKYGDDYNIAIIELDEGPRMLSRVLGISPEEVVIGMRVNARIEKPSWDNAALDPLVVFYPLK